MATAHRIQIHLSDISQLFNSMDPSPFTEKDLDSDAEEFIVSWAQEYPHDEPLSLAIHLKNFPSGENPRPTIEEAVHNYFSYRTKMTQLEFSRLMKQGRTSLIIGLFFLAGCLAASESLPARVPGTPATLLNFVREGLSIAGWVAMWRPMEIYLYDWWPLRRRARIFQKLSRIPVEVHRKE